MFKHLKQYYNHYDIYQVKYFCSKLNYVKIRYIYFFALEKYNKDVMVIFFVVKCIAKYLQIKFSNLLTTIEYINGKIF